MPQDEGAMSPFHADHSPQSHVKDGRKIPVRNSPKITPRDNNNNPLLPVHKCSSLPTPHPNFDATIALTLFRNHVLNATGFAHFKAAPVQPPRRYYVELRGSTMVLFKNAHVARAPVVLMKDIFAVLVLKFYSVTISKRQGYSPRLVVHGPGLNYQGRTLYIKVGTALELELWREALAIAESLKLPDLMSMTIESVIGQGGGGKVFLVHNKDDDMNYALKVIDKRHVFGNTNTMKNLLSERNLMQMVGQHPFILQLKFAFQTDFNLYFGTPFCAGGDLSTYLKNQVKRKGMGSPEKASAPWQIYSINSTNHGNRNRYIGHVSEDTARVIAAEVLLALEHLHGCGIVYRDLKPENVLISESGHIKLGDFGLSKHLQPSRTGAGFMRTSSICGTRNYLPPEMLEGKLYGFEVDLWSYGVMLFRIMCGRFPFDANRTKDVFQKVRKGELRMPDCFSEDAKDLLQGLLTKDQATRLRIPAVKNHKFFKRIDWNSVLLLNTEAPIRDIEMGQAITDALDNFEISKLHGITVGEYIPSDAGCNGETVQGPQSRMNPEGRIIGFEFVAPGTDSRPPPLEINTAERLGSGLRLRSLDSDVGALWRSARTAISPRMSKLTFFSPRSVKPRRSEVPTQTDSENDSLEIDEVGPVSHPKIG